MELSLKNELNDYGFNALTSDEMICIDAGGFWSSVLFGAVIGAVSFVALAASCGAIAPLVIAGAELSATTVGVGIGACGAVAGGIGGAIRGAFND